ncbi:uncharacterized protein CTHT_0013520 [Thermochaetoides thermophila DSM 1495]|uniref:ER membrane protein complex subunit 10 n=1 Tax=Chaetomium thermophilum (strain DSM 1495 / CBS 144.50 / IMI 039719) TaxID=759272 RepID=G0S1G5_CHATD|nr:hypothetical protein CTHT_0013520 [Thermochaetoides thermophila DSM 1495]EGS22875.1 hypothetical protein CTHT_0013520 [Thermochaetoides thermophila DSM 1495]
MKLPALLLSTLLATATAARTRPGERIASVYVQPLAAAPDARPTLLAEIAISTPPKAGASTQQAQQGQQQVLKEDDFYGSGDNDEEEVYSGTGGRRARVMSYDPPTLPEEGDSTTPNNLVRIGLYNPTTSRWESATTVLSAENFSKGYAPHFVLTVSSEEIPSDQDEREHILGVSCRGVKIDAGHTRDFGPKAAVVEIGKGGKPVLERRNVVLDENGRRVAVEGEEKTFFQKYWWAIALITFMMLAGGPGEEQK